MNFSDIRCEAGGNEMAHGFMVWLRTEVPDKSEHARIFDRFIEVTKQYPKILRELETKTPHDISVVNRALDRVTLAEYLREK